MNRNDKRHNSLRNKLFAAIAMLLVSSIMMVSTTYAWFTLSTAPEVQGITTTVGANGNLEIALSPYSGDEKDVTSGLGDAQLNWVMRNLTWGNLLDLSDASYGLADLKLMPARLYAQGNVLQPSPLYTPVYGADGRVASLQAVSALGTKLALNEQNQIVAADSYNVNAYKGIRAIGTASSDSKYAITFNNYLSAMGIAANNAQTYAKASLTANGNMLAEMAITHANAGAEDTSNYAEYVPYMENVIATLGESSAQIETALFSAVVAAGASNLSDAAAYELLIAQVEDPETTLDDLLALVDLDDTNPIMLVYSEWQDIEQSLTDAEQALSGAKAKYEAGQTVLWSDASPALSYLLNTTGITFNGGKNLEQFKQIAFTYLGDEPVRSSYATEDEYLAAKAAYEEAMDYMTGCITNMQINLGAGSGIYADIAALVGDLSASVRIDIIYPGMPALRNIPVTLATNAGGATGVLGLARSALREEGALNVEGQQTVSTLNDIYGYMVDFLFRTNATNSKLKLQTQAAQRVYGESSSEATLGGGSTMSFRTGALDAQAVQKLMGAVRVVFLDTNTSQIYGYAKLDMTSVREVTITPAAGETPAVLEYTADLYLYTSADNGLTLNDGDKKIDGELCDLPANTAKAVSAMVYLSGDHVDNSMVANGTESMTGSLNLQFASSAELKPMQNTALQNMAS